MATIGAGRRQDRYAGAVIGLAGVLHLGAGVWAYTAPRSFYDVVASFPPYHSHFLVDVGAFLAGLGTALLGALVWRDVRFVVLLGATDAPTLHWVSHLRDRHDGGLGVEPWLLGAFTLLVLVGLVLRFPARVPGPTGTRTEARR